MHGTQRRRGFPPAHVRAGAIDRRPRGRRGGGASVVPRTSGRDRFRAHERMRRAGSRKHPSAVDALAATEARELVVRRSEGVLVVGRGNGLGVE